MKSNRYIIIIFILFLGSCLSWKGALIRQGNHNDAVKNAIFDFVYKSKLSNKDSVFTVDIEAIDRKRIGISIMGAINKLCPTPENKIGTNQSYFPTRYFEYKKKLFYWYDSTSSVTSDLITILAKYKQIDSLNVTEIVGIPELIIDDSKKGVDYYFCKNNLLRYKKVTTKRGMGWYTPPNLKCK